MMRLTWQTLDIRWQAVAVSLLLSLYVFLFPEIPNDDAYIYFRTAEIFLSDGFAAASAHYSWPAYPILIGLISKLGLSLPGSALLINTFFYALLTWAFVSLVMTLSNSRPLALAAALTILVFPELNEFRFMAVRDTGFWALSVVAMWQLLLFSQQPRLSSALLFTFSLLFAAALRIEALVYLGALPLVCLLPTGNLISSPGRARLLLPVLVYGCGVLVLILLIAAGINIIGMAESFVSTYKPFLINLFSNDAAQSALLGQQLSESHGDIVTQQYAGGSLVFALLSELTSTFLAGMSGAFFWLLVYGAIKKYWPTRTSFNRELLAWLLINSVIVLAFLLLTRFLSSRYVMILCIVLATQIPFVVARLMESIRGKPHEGRYRVLLALFFVYCFIDAYYSFGHSRNYLEDAADYVAVYSQGQQQLLTNNHAIAFASGLVKNYDEVTRAPTIESILALPEQSLLALELIPQVVNLLESEQVGSALEFVTAFPSEAEPRVAIYRRLD